MKSLQNSGGKDAAADAMIREGLDFERSGFDQDGSSRGGRSGGAIAGRISCLALTSKGMRVNGERDNCSVDGRTKTIGGTKEWASV
jgi:hypothetical protein